MHLICKMVPCYFTRVYFIREKGECKFVRVLFVCEIG